MLHIETNKKWEAGWCRQVTRGKKASVKRRQGTSPKIQPQKQDASLSLLRSPSPAIALDFRANVRIPGSLLHTPSNIDISPVCTHFRCVRGDSRSRPSKTSSEIIHNSPWESERPSLPPSLPPSKLTSQLFHRRFSATTSLQTSLRKALLEPWKLIPHTF